MLHRLWTTSAALLTEALAFLSSSKRVNRGLRVGILVHSRCPQDWTQAPSSRSDRPKGSCLSALAFSQTSKGSPLGWIRQTLQHRAVTVNQCFQQQHQHWQTDKGILHQLLCRLKSRLWVTPARSSCHLVCYWSHITIVLSMLSWQVRKLVILPALQLCQASGPQLFRQCCNDECHAVLPDLVYTEVTCLNSARAATLLYHCPCHCVTVNWIVLDCHMYAGVLCTLCVGYFAQFCC